MQLVAQIDQHLAEALPLYQHSKDFAQKQYQQALGSACNIYTCTHQQLQQAQKTSRQIQRNAVWMIEHSTDDLLEVFENKLEIVDESETELEKTKRVLRILEQLRSIYITGSYDKLCVFGNQAYVKGKDLSFKYILPVYIQIRATLMVSW
jgi:hypothetical protein